jgi:LemA protein
VIAFGGPLGGSTVVWIAVAGVLVVLGVWVAAVWNRLVTMRNRVKNGFSQIDVQLQRRHDLIPNLVEATKAYLGHERKTLEDVTLARNAAVGALQRAAANPTDAAAVQDLSRVEGALGAALGRLFVLREAYPDLKASANVAHLVEELSTTENRIAFARQAYNDAVTAHNTAGEVFPASLLAGPFGYRRAAFYEVEDASHRAVPRATTS